MSLLPDDAELDFTASAYIIKDGEILFMDHSKLGKFLQPGGHIEGNETPAEAAVREAREETGLEIEIENFKENISDREEDLQNPFNVNIHRIREGHFHCDFAFIACVVDEGVATHSDEHDGLRWLSREQLENEELDMPDNVRRTALEALDENR